MTTESIMTKDTLPMSQVEFIALCAMMFSTIAFSIDAMLPALPDQKFSGTARGRKSDACAAMPQCSRSIRARFCRLVMAG